MAKKKATLIQIIGEKILYKFTSLYCKTLKFVVSGEEEINKLNTNFVIAFWHDEMLAGWYYNKKFNPVALISPSKDGDIMTKILIDWGYEVVRGSSNESGKEALNLIVDKIQTGKNFCLTPDGPKGPYHRFKAGAFVAAKRGEVPLILMKVRYEKYYTFNKSWDKFKLPKVFSKVYVHYSSPICIDKEATREEVNSTIEKSYSIMENLTEK
ncbi:MAG TPA: lysophospholipid acyltransferase family protein [Ignavibacteriales bacterium]|nr:lysophospholipid acyltransferase family protein [Ignavibacteriales bacterium]HPD66551.1 lysophospholipid acyltransferase family protein [Ignavibacteriales bacterium]HRR18402.1 lysophospholipid acyltransferase family protein [Ignavibacteriales bacterium]HRT99918.1 lysophospholipid acyltransferase family protein [Ignavibacteriales bacterium]